MPNGENQAGGGHFQIVKRVGYEVGKPSTTVKPRVLERGTQGWARQKQRMPRAAAAVCCTPAQDKSNKGTGFSSCQRVF